METWNERLKRLLDSRGLTYEQVAGQLECSKAAVGHWVSGIREPSLERFGELAKMLHIDAHELIFGIPSHLQPGDIDLLREITSLTTEQRAALRVLIREIGKK